MILVLDVGLIPLHDPTATILEQLKIPFSYLPPINTLAEELTAPPPSNCRFPLSNSWYAQISFRVPTSLVEQSFVLSTDQHSEQLLVAIVGTIIEPPPTGHTEESFHNLWDSLITQTIRLFCAETISYERNSNHFTSTGLQRPDLTLSIGEYSIFRAEEKGPETLGDPANELISKLFWTYDDLPYPCLLSISHVNGKITLHSLCTFNLQQLGDRLRLFNACRVVGRLLPMLASWCRSNREIIGDQLVIKRPVKTVELTGSVVKKKYLSNDHWQHARDIYRDLRWDNVAHEIGKTKDNANWFLLDFDEGVGFPQSVGANLDLRSHAPEIVGPHTNSVDVWGIGYLLQTSNLVREDDKVLGTLMKRCLAVNPLERPTISDCLEIICQCMIN
ncbi:4046_t:CDS:2 [Funneliformis geosporum]|uniref:2828_t:CDS:1 n=1 Tax=Funneliformis geosporum TaxID=1117311 RepID=A0A9W4SAD5_9GLOM|nr:2828_t:CDS:2 [Funneliformis geosporum]CAI2181890.1 4046_t:CDS:2 [Funneliformis geosporum]